ncbi:MAG TPA: exodeoxyribonuclease VII large subunit [Methylocella sp.]|nr:exodeoxyribonuclease VII large subunit [Methylocella sp.]
MPDSQKTNALEVSVSELSAALKRTVEDRFGFVRVRGEISNYRGQHSSGHAYFCLKDPSARIDAVIWKGTFARLKTKPQEGLEVIATGKVTTYPGKSTYQIIIEALEPAGIGALMAVVEERRRKLAAEGLFDEARKRPLPFLPACIGVITSPTGAVIRDILHRIAERFPRHVLLWPVRVQGETAAAEIAAAIDGFNALPDDGPLRRPDVLIVARGGGSLEDLWGFNEEIVVRAAARSRVPLIAAVGHETDWTLIDHAADLRAPTPTAAAEKTVPVRSELAAALADLARRQMGAAIRLLDRRRGEFRALLRALPQADSIFALRRQQLDTLEGRLDGARAKAYSQRHLDVARLSHRLDRQSPHARMGRAAERLTALERRLLRWRSTQNAARMQTLSYTLARRDHAISSRMDASVEQARGLEHRLKQQSPEPKLSRFAEDLEALQRRFQHGFARHRERRQQILDHFNARLMVAGAARSKLESERMAAAHQKLQAMASRMRHGLSSGIAVRRQHIKALDQLLGSLGYRQVLARGFALVRDGDGQPLRSAAAIADGARLDIEFADGHKPAIAGPRIGVAPLKRPSGNGRRKREQGSLF